MRPVRVEVVNLMSSADVVTTTFLSFQSMIEEPSVWLVRAGSRFLDSAGSSALRMILLRSK